MMGEIKLTRIRQIAITVTDVADALAFYRDILGLEYLFSASENLAFLAAGDVRLMLTTPDGGGTAGEGSILYFSVEDCDAAHEAMLARGARDGGAPELVARMPDHELWIGCLRDPDGNLVCLMEERR
jgi:predicted enzyme related to lactoylglutathione lyase